MSPTYRLERIQRLPLPLEKVFEFFADAFNLEAITPPFLRFRILTPRGFVLEAGTRIQYRLSLFGIPFTWHTLIEEFALNRRFVDRQERGPYALWHHTHEFLADGNETVMLDTVLYRLPLGLLGVLAHELAVRFMLAHIFDYRRRRVEELLVG